MKHYYLFLIASTFSLLPIAAVRPMTSLFAEHMNASIIQIGLLTACYSLTPLFFAIFAGRVVDRLGEKIPVIIGASGMTVSLLLPFLFPTLPTLFLSQLILGASQFIGIVAIQNGVTRSVPTDRRDKAIAAFSLFTSLGLMIGPLIGGYATEHFGFRNAYVIYSVFTIALLIIGFLLKSNNKSQAQTREKKKAMDVLSVKGIVPTFIISMIILSALDIYYVYYPLYASSIGLSPSEIGWILTVQSFAAIIVRVAMPFLISKFGKTQILFLFMLSGAIAYAFMIVFETPYIIMLIAFILGFGLGITQPVTIMITVQLAPTDRSAEALGMRLAGNRIAQVSFPIIVAAISNFVGIGIVFIIEAALLALGAFMARGLKAIVHEKNRTEENITS